MFTKTFTSISIATLATLGAFAMSVDSASARGFGGHGFGGHVAFARPIGFHRGGWWGHRRFGWGLYGAPLVTAAYLPSCYYVRSYGRLLRVCE